MIVQLILQILDVIKILLIVRALISWFPDVARGQIGEFIYGITEPMIMPVRNMLRKNQVFNNIPIDISFLVVYIGISMCQTLLLYLL